MAYSLCSCGAITLYIGRKSYSCRKENLKKYFPDIDLRKLKRFHDSYCCDHCVNHYGLDLCGCGSGAEFGKCENGYDECMFPMQEVGGHTCVLGKNALLPVY